MSALESPERISGSTFEEGIQEGLRLAHEGVVRSASKSRAAVDAYRWMIRDCRDRIVDLAKAMPDDAKKEVYQVIGILSALSNSETT